MTYLKSKHPPLFTNVLSILPKCILETTFSIIDSIHNIGTRQSTKGDLYAVQCETTKYELRSIHMQVFVSEIQFLMKLKTLILFQVFNINRKTMISF